MQYINFRYDYDKKYIFYFMYKTTPYLLKIKTLMKHLSKSNQSLSVEKKVLINQQSSRSNKSFLPEGITLGDFSPQFILIILLLWVSLCAQSNGYMLKYALTSSLIIVSLFFIRIISNKGE